MEADGISEHGGKVLHAGGLTETTDIAALLPTKQKISQPLHFSIATSPQPAALAEPQEVKSVDEASGTRVAARTAAMKKLEIEPLSSG